MKNTSLALAIDLISKEYKTKEPLILYEKIKTDLDMKVTIHQIIDYFEINNTDYEKLSNQIQYYSVTNN